MKLEKKKETNMYNIVIDGLEAYNIVRICDDENVSIKNIDLCYYIEEEGIKLFKDSKNTRIVIMGINLEYNERLEPVITATAIHQNIDIQFPKPKDKFEYIRATTVEFKDEEALKKWLESESIENYSRPKRDIFGIQVKVLNLSVKQEFSLASYGGKILSHNGRNPSINT